MKNLALSSLVLATALAGCATYTSHAAAPTMSSDGALTGSTGMTLYVFDKDVADSGKSACNGPCTNNWPPLVAKDGDQPSGHYNLIVRDDGRKQWTYRGKPLYYWAKDLKPGDRTGDGFNNVWHVARP